MTRGLGRRLAQTLKVACAAAIVVAAQACSQKSNELDPDDVDQVSQALAGDCGYDYNVCVIHTACESWGRDAQDDGLGYTTRAPWTETGPWYTMSCTDTYCDPPELDPCPNAQATRQDQLRAPIPSQPARDGLVVTLDEVNTDYWESPDCQNPYSQSCVRTWAYQCYLHVNNYPDPVTAVHPWCPGCAGWQPVDCEPNNIAVGGTGHTCALINHGLQCWGANTSGQLGSGTFGPDSVTPVQVTGMASEVYTVTAGGLHTCGIANGAARCWGQNSSGQLGNGQPGNDNTTLPDSAVPVDVTGLSNGVQGISGGNAHTCAVAFGAAKCWGNNDFGQIGDNTSNNARHSPTSVSQLSSGVQAITAGGVHSCAIVNGAARCWGFNGNGQLGKGSGGDSLVPAQVKNLTSGVQAITAGNLHTCAIVNGGVQCWGDNTNHQLGPATGAPNSFEAVPVTTLTSGVQAIAAGNNHTCARTTGGAIWCWGDNSTGQLGNGSNVPSSATPVQITALGTSALTIASGFNHSCAIANGGIQCWGLNGNSQLNRPSGMPTQSNVPLPITDFFCSAGSPISCLHKGCADGTIEQSFGGGMVGCGAAVTYANRATACSPGYQPATAAQWTANHGAAAPTHHYWTNDPLKYNGTGPSACFVSTTIGNDCGDTPMRVCRADSVWDGEANYCNWLHCGINTITPDHFFGGCSGNLTAGTLCVPVP